MFKLISFFVFLCFSSTVFSQRWDRANEPSIFNNNYKTKFGELPTTSTLKVIPWSDTYWPSQESGIAKRWNAPLPQQDFEYVLFNETQVRALNLTQLSWLSPAEKYDIFSGRFDYPTVRSEWLRTDPRNPDWEGLCHGWAPAAGFYTEPNNVTLMSPGNITIPFGSADVKALLTYFNAEYSPSDETWFISQRCNEDLKAKPKMEDTPACEDMNAATFHIILTNQIFNQQFFVADVDRSAAVWNQPIFKYSYSLVETAKPLANATNGTHSEVLIKTAMVYARESDPQWTSHGDDPVVFTKRYKYWLELSESKEILGGRWETWGRPDFSWRTTRPPFRGYFKSLESIYNASISIKSTSQQAKEEETSSMVVVGRHNVINNLEGRIGVENYVENHSQSWTISPLNSSGKITVEFSKLSTERNRDKVKIYEGKDGNGALLAVLHGNELPPSMTFFADSILIKFVSDRTGGGKGWELNFYASN